MLLMIFSDKKHLSTIIASFSEKSTKKALIEPKTLFKSRFVPFQIDFWPAKNLSEKALINSLTMFLA